MQIKRISNENQRERKWKPQIERRIKDWKLPQTMA